MYARLDIHHAGKDVVSRLQTTFAQHDPSVLDRSLVFKDEPSWRALVVLAIETPDYRLICYPPAQDQLQLHVEPIRGDIKRACGNVWRSTRRACRWRGHRLQLERLDVVDETDNRVIAYATAGWRSSIARRSLWWGLAVALATAIWLPLELFVFANDAPAETVRGAIPSLVLGAGAVLSLVFLRQRLVWKAVGW